MVRACAETSLLDDIIEGRMQGKATIGRKRTHLLSDGKQKLHGSKTISSRHEQAGGLLVIQKTRERERYQKHKMYFLNTTFNLQASTLMFAIY